MPKEQTVFERTVFEEVKADLKARGAGRFAEYLDELVESGVIKLHD